MQIEKERWDLLWVDNQPVRPHSFKEVDIDFRVSGLPHAVVKQAEKSRVRELVKKIESHPHRQDLQADLQQSNAYNPFRWEIKKIWFRTWSTVELFEKCNVQRALSTGMKGIVYCTSGHLLRENRSSRGFFRWILDLLSIPNSVIKKVRLHGNRCGKTEEQIKQHILHNLRMRCIKKVFEGIHDRFQKDSTFRESLLSIDRIQAVCIHMDKDAQKDFTFVCLQDEYMRYERKFGLSLFMHLDAMNDETPFRLQRRMNKIAPSSPREWRKTTRTDSFLAIPEMVSVVFFYPAHLGGSGTTTGGAHKIS